MHLYLSFVAVVGVLTCLASIVVLTVKRLRRENTIYLFGRKWRLVRAFIVIFMTGVFLVLLCLVLKNVFSKQKENEKAGDEADSFSDFYAYL